MKFFDWFLGAYLWATKCQKKHGNFYEKLFDFSLTLLGHMSRALPMCP
jgi:hypothetical protein